MTSFPSFSSFQIQGGIKGTGESSVAFEKKQQLQIANEVDVQMLSSGSEDEEKEVLKKLKRKRKKEKKKQLKRLLENAVNSATSDHSLKIIGTDFYIDLNGDVSNLKSVNRNQLIPAYKPPKPTKNFNPALFTFGRGMVSTRGLVKRINNCWIISGLDDSEIGHSPLSNLKNVLSGQVEPLYLYRGKNADDHTDLNDFIKLTIDEAEERLPFLENRVEAGGSLQFLEKCRELDRLVTRNPHSIDSWVAFIKLQDEMDAAIDKRSASMKNRIYEKKIAIVERALDENPNSDILLSILLELRAHQSDSRQMLVLWDSALEKNQTSFCLWKSYIDYRLSNAASFTLQSILELFEECLERMSALSASAERDQKLLFFISRLCAFFKAMGYFERAIAIFQALIELNCRSPQEMKWLERIGLFEDFWDSERARFGDLGAKGWIQKSDKQDPPTISSTSYLQLDHIEDPYIRWKRQELLLKNQQWLPLRNSIQDEIEDPFQTVMYQDIEPFLVQILTAKGKKGLIGSFLSFLKMPNSSIASSLSPYQEDYFLYQEFDNSAMFGGFVKKQENSHLSISFPFNCYPSGVEGLFGDNISWPTVLGPSALDILQEYGHGYIDYVCQVLEQSTDFIPSNWYYLLWIQSLSNPKKAEKTAKNILKSQPMNLPLWNVYAQLVLKLKGNPEARKIYQTILSMYKAFPESSQIGIGVLYSSLSLLEWENGSIDRAIAVLISHSERMTPAYDTEQSQERIMTARSILLEGAMDELQVLKEKGISSQQTYFNDIATILYLLQNAALLEFFIRRDAQAIIDVYNRALGFVEEKSLLQELIYQMLVHLLVKVMQSNAAFKPTLIRSVLEEALELFPSNTLLLTIFGMTEGKNRLDARMRRFLNDQLSKSNSFPLYIFSIWTEIHQTGSYNQAVIKSRIDCATQLFPSNPSVWMLALHFEENMPRRKQLFYQAIAYCPYSKGLFLMAFDELRNCFTPDELEELYGIMDDKEIRIIQPLETEAL